MEKRPRLIIFASGAKDSGGSGFRELVENNKTGILNADIVAVVSNHESGGVRKIADAYKVPFEHFLAPWDSSSYKKIVKKYDAEWIALSGWLKLVSGLDPKKTFNIHPGPLPEFGGDGMFSHHVHEAIISAYKHSEVKESAVTMHFVTKKYDDGPVFFRYPVLVTKRDDVLSLTARVNKIEHAWQSYITNLVIHQEISWDGKNPDSLKVPDKYKFLA